MRRFLRCIVRIMVYLDLCCLSIDLHIRRPFEHKDEIN